MIFENHGRQELPAQEERVESGVVRLEGDWPGLFIRGDDCVTLNIALDSVMMFLNKYVDPADLRRISIAVGIVGEVRMALGLVMMHSAAQNTTEQLTDISGSAASKGVIS